MIPVILSGGSGTRLWPYSLEVFTRKQFLPLVGETTMLQSTVERLAGSLAEASPIVVCNNNHRFMVAEQIQSLGLSTSAIVLEPAARNTAPAVALSALAAQAQGGDPILLVLPADHVINDLAAFHAAIVQAQKAAEDDKLVTFGIVPTHAETGYGYINAEGDETVRPVKQFVEKPNKETAEKYLASGEYFWNSGMFAFKASVFLSELKKYSPDILQACRESFAKAQIDLDFTRVDEDAFAVCPEDSIDYAVMEKTNKAVLIPLDADWSDVGSWSALWEISEKDEKGNVGRGDVIFQDSKNNFVQSDKKLITTLGVENLVIVETDDAILVADKDKVQDVKSIVSQLKAWQAVPRRNYTVKYIVRGGITTPLTKVSVFK